MNAPDPAQESLAHDDLDFAIDQAIEACDGDARAAIRSLLVANDFLIEHNAALARELDWAWHRISPGYTRSTNARRMSSGDPE
jgi:hypothetical protein